MNPLSGRFVTGLAIVALNVAGVACSSSTPLKKTGDAAGPRDFGREVQAVRDAAPDVTGPDLAEPDLAVPAIPDAPRASEDAALPDLPGMNDAINLADLPAFKDASLVDLPTAKDSVLADTPSALADAIPNDGMVRDLPLADLALPDAAVDRVRVCKPGAGQTCNDNPAVSAIWGACLPDGTCTCTAGHVINPNTGRCMMAPASDASTSSEAGPATICTGEYTACGCGCCGTALPLTMCYYPSLGETIAAVTAQDEATRISGNCAGTGCSRGIRYLCCAPPAPDLPSGVTYSASGYSGGLDHVTISKSGADCATLSFARLLRTERPELKIAMPGTWGVVIAEFGACGDAGAMDRAGGAVGTFALRASGSLCLADVHATLFVFTAAGEVKAARFDADGLTVTGLPAWLCN